MTGSTIEIHIPSPELHIHTPPCSDNHMQAHEYLVYIDQITTTPELWAKLQAIFESKVAVNTVNICWEFFWTFAEDGANMKEHMCKLCRLY